MSAEAGFLGDTSRIVRNIRADFAPWFDIVERLNRLAMRLLPQLRPPVENHQLILWCSLYGRAVMSVQAAALLAERGQCADARTIIRAATETAITLGALIVDEAVIDLLLRRHAYSYRAIRNAWLNDPRAVGQMTEEQIASVRQAIVEVEREFPALRDMRGDPFKIEQVARIAGDEALALYNAIYRPTSTDAAHTSFEALNRHFKLGDDGSISGLNFGPNVSDLAGTLSAMASNLAYVIYVAIRAFGLREAYEPELGGLVGSLKALGTPDEYRPPSRA
jgi:hypothetical protein